MQKNEVILVLPENMARASMESGVFQRIFEAHKLKPLFVDDHFFYCRKNNEINDPIVMYISRNITKEIAEKLKWIAISQKENRKFHLITTDPKLRFYTGAKIYMMPIYTSTSKEISMSPYFYIQQALEEIARLKSK